MIMHLRSSLFPRLQNRSFIRADTALKWPWTLPGCLPSTSFDIASRASWIFLNPPRICTCESARTTRVLVAFSIAYLVLPSLPATRAIARERCSGPSLLMSLISKPAPSCQITAPMGCVERPDAYFRCRDHPTSATRLHPPHRIPAQMP
jgi:hypothetical protein